MALPTCILSELVVLRTVVDAEDDDVAVEEEEEEGYAVDRCGREANVGDLHDVFIAQNTAATG